MNDDETNGWHILVRDIFTDQRLVAHILRWKPTKYTSEIQKKIKLNIRIGEGQRSLSTLINKDVHQETRETNIFKISFVVCKLCASLPPPSVVFLLVTMAAFFVIFYHDIITAFLLFAVRRQDQVTVLHDNVGMSLFTAFYLVLTDQHSHTQNGKQKDDVLIHFDDRSKRT